MTMVPENLRIFKKREIYEFESLNSIKCKHEITFIYEGDGAEGITKIPYNLGKFRALLSIFDSNGEKLEFQRIDPNQLDIMINLPLNRPLLRDSLRTIYITYISGSDIISVQTDTKSFLKIPYFTRFTIQIFQNCEEYIFIRPCKNFNFFDTLEVFDKNGVEISIDQIKQDPNFFINKDRTHFKVFLRSDSKYNQLIITHEHALPKTFIWWYMLGIGFGISAIFCNAYILSLIPQLPKDQNEFMVKIVLISFSALVLNFLLIMKGWLFLKDMDHDLDRINTVYLVIISIIVGMIFIVILSDPILYLISLLPKIL